MFQARVDMGAVTEQYVVHRCCGGDEEKMARQLVTGSRLVCVSFSQSINVLDIFSN